MSTITRELAKLFRKITNSEIDADGNAHVVLSPADSLLINNARIALASLEAEPVAWAHRLINKRNGVVHPWVYGSAEACPSEGDIFNIEVMPLYTAPPAPVAVPECFKRLLHHAYGMTMGHDWNKGTMAGHHRAKLCQAVDECRAAMLQGADGTLTNEGTMQLSGNSEQIEPVSNSDELPLDYLQGHKDGLEWAAQLAEANHPQTGDWLYDDQIDLARAIRKGPDMPTVQGGNSPVTPDGWIPVSERMPEPYEYVLVTDGFDGCEVMRVNTDGYWGPAKSLYPGSITHWMPLPAAPQQEVK
ncbi:DUF551 domain-containing protein [Escherichia coli]|uniref:DUF551 domain-containing protein n=2 Tax=Escherichia coli TaxID=562 RepID=UPI0033998960